MEIEIRFHSPDDPVIGPRGNEAEHLAYPDGQFASDIEYAGRKWKFHHTERMSEPGSGEEWERLVYVPGSSSSNTRAEG
jgi:hypothetical protein